MSVPAVIATGMKSCEGAPQQAANGMYKFVEMLAGWAMTL